MTISLQQPQTGETKMCPEGWSWSCCIGVGILGLPLFRRGLVVWGSLMVVFNIVALVVAFVPTQRAEALGGWLTLIWLASCVFFGFRANQLAINRYRDLGWIPAERWRANWG